MTEMGVETFGEGNWDLILNHYDFDGRKPKHINMMWQIVLKSKVVKEVYKWDWETWYWNDDWEVVFYIVVVL